MRYVIDVLHPAHVHFFRNFVHEMKHRGHVVLVAARDKEVTTDLLQYYQIPYTLISRQRRGLGLGAELVARTARLLREGVRFGAEAYLGIMGPSISLVGAMTQTPAYIFYDTEHAKLTNRYAFPLAKAVITPDCFWEDLGRKHVRYAGYHELSYLHPNRFTADPSFCKRFGFDAARPLFVLRFVSWAASHDIGQSGLTVDLKRQLARRLSAKGRLLITAEGELPREFEPYRMSVPFHEVHNLLHHATLYLGEGATMASEAAVLGTTALYINSLDAGVLQDQAKIGNLIRFDPGELGPGGELLLQQVDALLEDPHLKERSLQKRSELIKHKVDVTDWMLNYFDQ